MSEVMINSGCSRRHDKYKLARSRSELPSKITMMQNYRYYSVTRMIVRHRSLLRAGAGAHYASGSGRPKQNSPDVHDGSKSSMKPNSKHDDLAAAKHQVKHRAQETIGIKLTASVVEKVAELAERGIGKAAASRTASIAERAAAKRLAKQAALRTAERVGHSGTARSILRRIPVREAVVRVGRGLLIAVPIAGAAFAAWIGKADIQRTLLEIKLARADILSKQDSKQDKLGVQPGEAHVPGKQVIMNATVMCFGAATVADSINVLAHLVLAYGLYKGWDPHSLLFIEQTSLAAAASSTVVAVVGEISSAHRKEELKQE